MQNTVTTASGHAWYFWPLILLLVALAIWLWILILKGRRLPGDHVFRASRLSQGNRLLPAQVAITPTSITLYRPQWIGKAEESIHMAHISSVKIDTNLMFSNVFIETSGGHSPIKCHGHLKGDAIEMKRLIEKFQSDYYRAGAPQGQSNAPAPTPAPPRPGPPPPTRHA